MIAEQTIDNAIRDLFRDLSFPSHPRGLYDPLRYMISIGGKRLRPRLCLLSYSLFADRLDEHILQPAAGVEVFHTFSLIHDDVMDRSPLRRGHETVWKKWGTDAALLSGDVMSIDSFRRVCMAPAQVLPQVLDLFVRTTAQVCEGQQLDMDYESLGRPVTMEEYLYMVGRKTGVLLACPAAMGALIGGAPAAAVQALYDYGHALGLAFQVADDYLDVYGDEQVFGKPIGGDIVNGKQSWLAVRATALGVNGLSEALALPVATAQERAAKIAAVRACYDAAGLPAAARQEIASLQAKAVAALAPAGLAAEGVARLQAFADRLLGRTR